METVILVHPFPLSSRAFAADVAALSDRMRLLTPDMRGFGDAPRFEEGAPPSVDAMADDVLAFLDANGARGRAIVGGISMGGYVALAFARRHPDRLRGLVLADTRAEPDSDEARAAREKTITTIASGDQAGFVEGMLEKLLSPKTRAERPEVVERVRGMAMAAAPAALVDALRALRDRPDARAGLAVIRVPTLVLVGQEDVITPPAAAEVMRAGIEGAELVTIPDAGHLANLEQPVAFQSALAAFVARVERG